MSSAHPRPDRWAAPQTRIHERLQSFQSSVVWTVSMPARGGGREPISLHGRGSACWSPCTHAGASITLVVALAEMVSVHPNPHPPLLLGHTLAPRSHFLTQESPCDGVLGNRIGVEAACINSFKCSWTSSQSHFLFLLIGCR